MVSRKDLIWAIFGLGCIGIAAIGIDMAKKAVSDRGEAVAYSHDEQAERRHHIERFIAHLDAFTKHHVDGNLAAATEAFMDQMKADYPNLYARHEADLRTIMHADMEAFEEDVRQGYRDLFEETFTTRQLERFVDRMEGDEWRPEDLRALFQMPEFLEGNKRVMAETKLKYLSRLTNQTIPKMQALGFFKNAAAN